MPLSRPIGGSGIVNLDGVHNTLKHDGIRGEVGHLVAEAFKEDGHLGHKAVIDKLHKLNANNEINDRELRHAMGAIERHTSTEETV